MIDGWNGWDGWDVSYDLITLEITLKIVLFENFGAR